jgi:hypothetical protein
MFAKLTTDQENELQRLISEASMNEDGKIPTAKLQKQLSEIQQDLISVGMIKYHEAATLSDSYYISITLKGKEYFALKNKYDTFSQVSPYSPVELSKRSMHISRIKKFFALGETGKLKLKT